MRILLISLILSVEIHIPKYYSVNYIPYRQQRIHSLKYCLIHIIKINYTKNII